MLANFDKNVPFLFAAYAVFLAGFVFYGISLWVREKSLRKEQDKLTEWQTEQLESLAKAE